jgi:hypothetical protein
VDVGCPVLALVGGREVNVRGRRVDAVDAELTDSVGHLEPCCADLLPVAGVVSVPFYFLGASRVFLLLVRGAVAALAGS